MMRSREPELARRVRAAWAYSGLSQEELAEAAGLKEGTIRGYLSKSRPNTPGPADLAAIADACGVPRSFMEEGFGASDPELVERVAGLELGAAALLQLVEAALDEIEAHFASRIEQHVSEALKQARGSLYKEGRQRRA
jgi:transcriptional regulator with XRE-family HTH domain